MKANKAKKSSKFLLIGIIILILGTVFFVCGMSVLDWKFENLDTTVYTQHIFNEKQLALKEEDTISKVNIDSSGWNIKVVNGEEFNVEYYTTEETTESNIKISYENGAINFVKGADKSVVSLKMFNGMKKWKYIYVFTVPENIDLNVKANNSGINLENINLTNLDVESNNGHLDLTNVNTGNLKIAGKNFSMDLEKVNATNIECSGNNGAYDLSEVKADKMELNSDNASIDINKVTLNEMDVKGNNSNIDIIESKIGYYDENSETLGGIILDSKNMSFYSKDSELKTINIKANNSSVELVNTIVVNYVGNGNNASFKTENCSFKSVEITNKNGSVKMVGTKDCNNFKFSMDNGSVKVNLIGTKEEFKSIKADGENMSFRIDDEKFENDSYSNTTGTKEFAFSGKNANVKVDFN